MRVSRVRVVGFLVVAYGCSGDSTTTVGMDASRDATSGRTDAAPDGRASDVPDARALDAPAPDGGQDAPGADSAVLDSGAPGPDAERTDAGLADADTSDAASTEAGVEPMCGATAPCTWRRAMPATSPPVLAWAAMAYSSAEDRVILFGGAPTINGGPLTDRTWAWDGSTWTELFPSTRPPARWTHGMVDDEARGRLVLFGGQSSDQPGAGLADTWEWYADNWHAVSTTRAPTPRGVHGAIAYDATRREVVVRGGGTLPGQTLFADTWVFDGTDWREVAGAGPSERVAPALVYDRARGELLLFGGGRWSPYFGDMWRWNGASWSEIALGATAPSDRQSARAIYEPTRGVVLLFGGADDSGLLGDLWAWDGAGWAAVPVPDALPRCCYGFAHDTRRNEAVLFGGPDDQTWVYGRAP